MKLELQPHGYSKTYYKGQMWNMYHLNDIKTHWTNLTCLERFENRQINWLEVEFYTGNSMYYNNHDNVATKTQVNMIIFVFQFHDCTFNDDENNYCKY